MHGTRFIQLVTFELKDGVDEHRLLQASNAFQEAFVSHQPGIQQRLLLRAKHGGYADLIFFDSQEHADRIAGAESSSEPFRALLQLLRPAPAQRASGVLSFEQLKAYDGGRPLGA